MANTGSIERRIARLEALEEIRQLKFRYWRHLDLKEWDALAECFTEDASAAYGSGKYSFDGREAIMAFLSDALGEKRGSVTIHHGHHPEIEVTGENAARGTFALYNYMFNEKARRGIRIGAYYEDEFVRVDGTWKIAKIGYREIFHEEWNRDDIPSNQLVE